MLIVTPAVGAPRYTQGGIFWANPAVLFKSLIYINKQYFILRNHELRTLQCAKIFGMRRDSEHNFLGWNYAWFSQPFG